MRSWEKESGADFWRTVVFAGVSGRPADLPFLSFRSSTASCAGESWAMRCSRSIVCKHLVANQFRCAGTAGVYDAFNVHMMLDAIALMVCGSRLLIPDHACCRSPKY